jgi:hypothetical protein
VGAPEVAVISVIVGASWENKAAVFELLSPSIETSGIKLLPIPTEAVHDMQV